MSRLVVIALVRQHFPSGDGIRQIGRRSTSHICLHYSRGRCWLRLPPPNIPTVMPSVDKTRGSPRDAITTPKNPSGVVWKQVMRRHLGVRKDPKLWGLLLMQHAKRLVEETKKDFLEGTCADASQD